MATLISTNPLLQPLQAPQTQTSSSKKAEVGSTLEKRIAAFVVGLKLLNDAATFATKKGTKAVCAATTLSSALSGLMEGNLLKASCLGVSGLKETYDLLMRDGTLKGIKSLLRENQAGLDVTKEILGYNKLVLKQTSEGVDSIGQHLSSIEKDLDKIEKLSDQGRKDLKEEKKAVIELYKSADAEYALAQKNFQTSQANAQEANVYFNKTVKGFSKIYKLAQKDGAQLSEAVKIAEKMQKNCEKAQKRMQQCMASQEKAKGHSDKAHETYRQASLNYGQIIGKAEMALSKIQEINNKAQEKVENAQRKQTELAEKVGILQKNNNILYQVNEDLLDNNRRLMVETQNMETYSLLDTIGAITGAVAGQVLLGPAGGVAGGVMGLELVHHRNKIARKTGDWLFGIKEETSLIFAAAQKAAWKFDDFSSGCFGRYWHKRSSATLGRIALKLGEKEIFELKFNLKEKKIVKDADLYILKDVLAKKVAFNELSPAECLDFIKSLEEMKIGSSKTGVISNGHSIFYMLKDQCKACL